MLKVILLLLFFLVAMAAAPMLVGEKGYVLVNFAGYTIESTVVSALFLLCVSFIAVTLVYLLLRTGFRLTSTSWQSLLFSRRSKAQQSFQQAIVAYLLGEYKQAESLMAKHAENTDMMHTAWLVAAKAASQTEQPSNAKHYLALLDANPAAWRNTLDALVLRLDLLLQQKSWVDARRVLDENHKLIGHDHRLLGCEIKLTLAEQRFNTAIDLIATAKKKKKLTDAQIIAWERKAFIGAMQAKFSESGFQGLADYWQSLNKKQSQQPAIILAYADVLASHQLEDMLINLIHPLLNSKNLTDELADGIKQLPLQNAQPLIAEVQKQLQKTPGQTRWLSLLGHLAAAGEDWHTAEKAFVELSEGRCNNADLAKFAYVLSRVGEHKKATAIYDQLLGQSSDYDQ